MNTYKIAALGITSILATGCQLTADFPSVKKANRIDQIIQHYTADTDIKPVASNSVTGGSTFTKRTNLDTGGVLNEQWILDKFESKAVAYRASIQFYTDVSPTGLNQYDLQKAYQSRRSLELMCSRIGDSYSNFESNEPQLLLNNAGINVRYRIDNGSTVSVPYAPLQINKSRSSGFVGLLEDVQEDFAGAATVSFDNKGTPVTVATTGITTAIELCLNRDWTSRMHELDGKS